MATLGNRKKKRTGWWTEDVKAEVDRKKELFRIWLKNRTPENRAAYVKQRNYVNQVKKWARKGMWTRIGNDLQEDVRGTKKLLYSMSKAYKGRNYDKPKNTTLKAESGEIITGQNNVSNRWAEYFQYLLNVTDEDNHQERDCGDPTPHLAASTDQDDPIRMDELEATLKLTKTRKIRLRAVDWYASALSHTALLPKSLVFDIIICLQSDSKCNQLIFTSNLTF